MAPSRAIIVLVLLPCALGFMSSFSRSSFASTNAPQLETKSAAQLVGDAAPHITNAMHMSTRAGAPITAKDVVRETSSANKGSVSPGLKLAIENAQKLSEGDLSDVEFISGPGDLPRRSNILEKAYAECERITGIFAKTFYLGTKFMPEQARKAVWAIYVWCRRTDDIVDGPRAMVRGKQSLQKDLKAWTNRLEDVWEGRARDALDLALVDAKEKYPLLDIRPFKDMIGGMLLDIPGAGKNRYGTFAELEEYCYRVAGTVGLMTLPVLGTAKGVTQEQAKEPALSLGIALQLTNILRDVGEDAVRGRIYLPMDDMKRFGVSEDNIMNGILDDNYRKLMAFQIARARYYYAKAAQGVPMLAPESRLPVQASLDMYGRILSAIELNGYDNFRKRAYVSKTQKLLTLPSSWWRSMTPPSLSELEAAAEQLAGGEFRLTRFDLMPEQEWSLD